MNILKSQQDILLVQMRSTMEHQADCVPTLSCDPSLPSGREHRSSL